MSEALQLDAMYGAFLDKKATPMKFEFNHNLTFFKEIQEAFALNSPGIVKQVKLISSEDTNDGCVVRVCIGYKHVSTIKDDYFNGIFILSLIKNAMLAEAAIHFNLDTCSVVSFKMPWQKGYFHQLQEMAGYELRLVVKK